MGKHYIVGRGRCPRCGMEGTVILRVDGSKPYVYVRHGRTWHYIGTLDKVSLESMIMVKNRPEITTRHHDTTYRKAIIIAVITMMVTAVIIGIVTKYLWSNNINANIGNDDGFNNAIKTITVNYDDPELGYEITSIDYGGINNCPPIDCI